MQSQAIVTTTAKPVMQSQAMVTTTAKPVMQSQDAKLGNGNKNS